MDSSLFAFTTDLPDADPTDHIGQIRERFGVRGLTVAAAYHQARDVTPHGPTKLTVRHDGVHFPPDPGLFSDLRLTPPVQDDAAAEPMVRLREATRAQGMSLHGWGVFCHNTALGSRHPECTVQSCFGDRGAPGSLCPANPDVRAYAVALARNIARYDVDSVVAESLHHGTFDHGYHHERALVRLTPMDRFLFGLCFCPHCVQRARTDGVDAETARAECATAVGRVLNGEPSHEPEELTRRSVVERAGPATADYLDSRVRTVTSLVTEVSAAVRDEGSRLVFLDSTGAVKGYADGAAAGPSAADDAWQTGIDPAAVSRTVHAYGVLAYSRDQCRIAADVAAYRAACAEDTQLRVVLRPGAPDTESQQHLADTIAAVNGNAEAVDFYHYGLNTLTDLDRIPHALPNDR